MDEIKWLEVAINTTPERLDEITAKLTAAGMTGLVIEDEAEFQQFLEQNRQYWDYVDQELMERMRGVTRVKFYVTDDADGRTQLERYTRGLECEYTTRTLVDNDWAYSWQKYYKPLSIGERLYVVPQCTVKFHVSFLPPVWLFFYYGPLSSCRQRSHRQNGRSHRLRPFYDTFLFRPGLPPEQPSRSAPASGSPAGRCGPGPPPPRGPGCQ